MSDTLFYVYVLSRPNGEPFYVGMGSNERMHFHEIIARRGDDRSEKSHIIRKIWADGGAVGKEIRGYYEWDVPAKAAERKLIAEIGRKDNGHGPLVNRTDGGDGWSGLVGDVAENHRKRTAEGMAKPEIRELCRQNMARMMAVPLVAERIKKQLRDYWADPENRRRQSERVCAFNAANPEIAHRQRGAVRSPETRAKMRDGKATARMWRALLVAT